MPVLQGPAAAVSLHQVDTVVQTVTAEVQILVPGKLGARRCEQDAVGVLSVLRKMGAEVKLEGCRYLSKGDVFSTVVKGTFAGEELDTGFQAHVPDVEPEPEPEPEKLFFVSVDGIELENPVSFRSWKQAEEREEGTVVFWQFRLEDVISSGSVQETDPQEPFEIQVTRGQAVETYLGCVWTWKEQTFSEGGIRRIREGKAQDRL